MQCWNTYDRFTKAQDCHKQRLLGRYIWGIQARVRRQNVFGGQTLYVQCYFFFLSLGLPGFFTAAFFFTRAFASASPMTARSNLSPVWYVMAFRLEGFSILTLGSITPRFWKVLNLSFARKGVPFKRRKLPSISSESNTWKQKLLCQRLRVLKLKANWNTLYKVENAKIVRCNVALSTKVFFAMI